MTSSTVTYFAERACEARRSALDATNPVVRAIYRDLDRRFQQLAAFPDVAPLGPTTWSSHPTGDAPALQSGSVRRQSLDGDAEASTRGNERWENEGGAYT
jgi:hypothetical protein